MLQTDSGFLIAKSQQKKKNMRNGRINAKFVLCINVWHSNMHKKKKKTLLNFKKKIGVVKPFIFNLVFWFLGIPAVYATHKYAQK